MSRFQIAVALVVSAVLALAVLALATFALATDRDQSTPRGDGDAAAEPEPGMIRPCKTAVFGDLVPGWRKRAVVAGPLALLPWEPNFGGPGLFRPDAVIKVLAVVDAGARVTLAVPDAERRRVSLLYDFGLRAEPRPSVLRRHLVGALSCLFVVGAIPGSRDPVQRRFLRSRRALRRD